MEIREIRLRDYRNYERAEVKLGGGTTVFTGRNAQGKTNLLESVYFAGVGRSARTPRDRELIRWGQESAEIVVDVEKKSGRERIEIALKEREKKRILINGIPILRMGELMGAVNVIYFSPDEIKLIKDGPTERRRFLDIDISQLSKAYFYTLTRYNNILSQRNKLLKNTKDMDTLEIWDAQLAKEGARLIKTRRGFLERLRPHAKNAHLHLSDNQEALELEYISIDGDSYEEIFDNIVAKLKNDRQRDIEHGYTHSGPHKDDVAMTISKKTDRVDLRSFGSQGQQRTAALSLKLAELEIFADLLGEYPVLLLDDVMSELDPARRRLLLDKTKNIQTIITSTDPITDLPATHYIVSDGTITRQK